jgi:hypothetical protein
MHRWYEPAGWHAWESLEVRVGSDPVACSWGADRLDLFVTSPSGELLHGWWDGVAWSFGGAG